MKFVAEKKRSIIMYMLEQIGQGGENISQNVSEKCGVSRNTVIQYLNELTDEGIIRRVQRNRYEMICTTDTCVLHRSEGQLNSETYVYDRYFEKHIKDCSNEAKRIWQYAFSEMVNNVIDHSEAEHLNITVEKNHVNTTLRLTDDGIGIFKKIKEHFSLADLDEARCELFKGKLTTDEKNHSGEGIFFTSRMMDAFYIISGGKFFSVDKYETEQSLDIDDRGGTTVIMSLSNYSQRDISEVFDQYASVDGGFTKTRLPLKSIFDNAPISRSQAKRVCYRLEKFSEITLDFRDIEWMGQAFAHQLFVVYQREHPEMILKPINMCEDVQKIYDHVMNTK